MHCRHSFCLAGGETESHCTYWNMPRAHRCGAIRVWCLTRPCLLAFPVRLTDFRAGMGMALYRQAMQSTTVEPPAFTFAVPVNGHLPETITLARDDMDISEGTFIGKAMMDLAFR